MSNSFETLEHQTAPESTRGLFDSPLSEKKYSSHRESAPVPDKPSSFGEKPSYRGHQRSRSTSDFNTSNRSKTFGLQTLVEEDDHKNRSTTNLDSLQDMINTLKNLPPLISNHNLGNNTTKDHHRKQASMSALVGGHQTSKQKRLSHHTETEQPLFDQQRRRSGSISNKDNKRNSNMFNALSRDEALAEAEAKLMGTFQPPKNTRRNSDVRPPFSRRYSDQQYDNHVPTKSMSSGLLTNKRTSLQQMPTLNENTVTESGTGGRRINFNKPLNLTAAKEDALNDGKRLSAGNSRRSSRNNMDFDWRASSTSSFQMVPFTPTRVNFARDDANPHQRRPLFVAHLPFSALPPLFRARQLSRGALRVNKRNRSDAYVYCEDLDDDIYICGSRDRNRALEGDVVAVRLVDVDKVLSEKKEKEEAKLVRNGGQVKVRVPDEEDENEIIFGGDEGVDIVKPKYCGIVVAILERAQNQVFSGTLTLMRPNNKRAEEEKAAEEARKSIHGKDALFKKEAPRIVWFKSTDKRVPLIAIPVEQAPEDFVDNSEAYATKLFVSSMKRWPITSLHPFGTLEREIGSVYELSTQTKAIYADNNVTDSDFTDIVRSCLPTIPFELEIDSSRRDLREDTITFTIDPVGSNVLDDALSIRELDNDTWEVGVHITDVTYFIKSQSALDKEARARAVRVDLMHTFVPMLPQELTEQVTNLSPNETRFTFSVIWKINKQGEILDTWFGKTMIRSSAKFTYEEAQTLLDNPSHDDAMTQPIVSLSQLSKLLHTKRTGDIFTQTRDELCYELQGEEPVTVSMSQKNEAAKMVKEFLYLANKSVAQKISRHLPDHALLRRHAPPSERKIKELCEYTSRHLGVQLDVTNAGTLEASIQAITDAKLKKLVSVIVLKTFETPKYFCAGNVDINKYAHYALNIPLFTHFTAPSRRFADIIVHRQLEASLLPGDTYFALDKDTVQKLAQHCNVKKDAAFYARDQSNLMFLSIHMHKLAQQQQVPESVSGSSFIFREAIVIAVFDQYFDVIIPELNLEKRIHLVCLPVWRSDYNEQIQSLTMFWRKGVDTSTGKKVDWGLSDEEDELDEDALLEEMNDETLGLQEKENDYKRLSVSTDTESVVSRLAIGGGESKQSVVPNKSVSTPIVNHPESTRSSNRRASIVRARLSDSTAFSTEQGFQTIKALDKIRVVLITELARTPPLIRILAANPFS